MQSKYNLYLQNMNLVCLYVHVIQSHQKFQRHEILSLDLICANNIWRSPIFEILIFKAGEGGPHMVQC